MVLKTLIVDDEPVARRVLREDLEQIDEIALIAEAEDGASALDAIHDLSPDLVFLDLQMPVMGGLDAARLIRTADPNAKIVIFTMHESQQMKDEIARIGVQAHAVKSAPMKNLLDTIKSVLGTDEPRVN